MISAESPNSISSYDKNKITGNGRTTRNVNKVFNNNEDNIGAIEEKIQ